MKKTPEQVANWIIAIMLEAGLSPDEMLKVIQMTREKIEKYRAGKG